MVSVRSNLLSLVVFVIGVVVCGALIGVATAPGPWFDTLVKPAFNPPAWVFGPVWTTLYILIGIAGWRIWHVNRSSTAMKLWFAQMILNFAWSPLFFGAHRMDLALGVIVLMLIAIFGFILTSWNRDRISAVLFLPYAAWVSFATLLNASLLYLNS
ncbi:TspO/MBR family protein [Neptunicoccus cionae]|uniref:TspO/MBR family protein n=1 Tax=Neptunicoccus cionae TaxID=2035344 RepID=UPI000C76324B|nr:TspO/MBR family protein [Amylibacter cionae]PLS22794.1 sensor histidine kinase [Amylibacter cionae]